MGEVGGKLKPCAWVSESSCCPLSNDGSRTVLYIIVRTLPSSTFSFRASVGPKMFLAMGK